MKKLLFSFIVVISSLAGSAQSYDERIATAMNEKSNFFMMN